MEKKVGYNISISEIQDVPNPDPERSFITNAKFILADDKPNENGQAIHVEEFPGIIASAIGMPVKMNFTGYGVANHGGSVPIGHIKNVEQIQLPTGVNQLIAEATLWNEEFPDEISYLKTSFAEGEAPGISYEMGYKDSQTISGIQWLKKVITLAATFVRNPAYGTRTHLLALAASDMATMTCDTFAAMVVREAALCGLVIQDVIDALEAIVGPDMEDGMDTSNASTNNEKGGNLMTEEELTQLRAEAATKQSEIDALMVQLTDANNTVSTLQGELDAMKVAAISDNRIRQYTDAGFTLEADAEKAEKKKNLFVSLHEDQWTEYLADLIAAKATVTTPVVPVTPDNPTLVALAEATRRNAIPKLEMADEDKTGLKDAMRRIARPYSA